MPCAGYISFSVWFFLFLFAVSIQMPTFVPLNIVINSAKRIMCVP